MKARTRKKRGTRAWARIQRVSRRALDRHDRWDVLAALSANPWLVEALIARDSALLSSVLRMGWRRR